MNKTQKTIKSVINNTTFLPYGRGDEEGATKQVDWQGEKILRKGTVTSCVWATTECLLESIKLLGAGEPLTVEQVKTLRAYAFVYDIEENKGGIAAGMVEIGIADWVEDPQDAQYGDFAQMWAECEGENPVYGHSVVITGTETKQTGSEEEPEERLIINTWSAEKFGVEQAGIAHSWYNAKRFYSKGGKTYARKWYIARLKEDWINALGK